MEQERLLRANVFCRSPSILVGFYDRPIVVLCSCTVCVSTKVSCILRIVYFNTVILSASEWTLYIYIYYKVYVYFLKKKIIYLTYETCTKRKPLYVGIPISSCSLDGFPFYMQYTWMPISSYMIVQLIKIYSTYIHYTVSNNYNRIERKLLVMIFFRTSL